MNRDLLLEIGVEEIPSAYMTQTLENLRSLAVKSLAENRLSHGEIKTMGTPRRLVLLIPSLAERQSDAVVQNRGPRKSAAFDQSGNPTKAGLGFARSQGFDISQLTTIEADGVEYVAAVRREEGQAAAQILPELLTEIIQAIPFPRSMRWGYYQTRFARPIRWLLCLLDSEVIPLTIENIDSSRITYGHRFLSQGPLAVKDVEDYFAQLEAHYVILDQDRRSQMIWRQVEQAAAAAGGKPMENAELLEEVNFLVEYPTAFFGGFSPAYLDVPAEVLTTSMIEHQRYFPVFDREGQLLPGFIGVRNGTDFDLETVIAGNQRVLKARLEDALFFWREDTKKPIQDFVPGLANVMFHERLGSVLDKVGRLQALAVFCGVEAGLSTEQKLDRAAFLCKADLLSNMVYEFPELQGVMGRYYAVLSQEDQEVADAILEHYLPRFAGDKIPATQTGLGISLAEKIDNLVGCFALNIKPTGSQDPYALRRQAIGLVNIILEARLKLDLTRLLDQAYQGFKAFKLENTSAQTTADLMDFIRQRMRGVLLEKGYSYDVIDAVLAAPNPDLYDILTRVDAIQGAKAEAYCTDLMVVFNRAHNLSRKADPEVDFDEKNLIDASEMTLYQQLLDISGTFAAAMADQRYKAAIEMIASLRPSLDQFFEAVMVMVDDDKVRQARLGLLNEIAKLCQQVADFTKIVQ
ncbi:MAG TPA: glycine--tRNA ligase subunit beta [Syntrophomonas sp.]|jgi:glycyl-tRNA synthetase beta chain|nr:glycine--tRNA ligase subunit beta [Syntrophomonas sp.]